MKLLLSLLLTLPLSGQTPNAVPMPQPEIQYLGSNGLPLAGAKLCTYAANSTTPQATYTDSSAATPNTNPIILDVNGRASVWVGYKLGKFVLRVGGDGTCSTGTVLWTQDNVGILGNGILNAINIVETAGDSSGKGGYIDLQPIDYPGTTCLDVYGNQVNQPIALGGFPAFGANDAILWVSKSPLAGVAPPNCASAFTPNEIYGLNLNTYMFVMGGVATNQTSYNSFDSLAGGMHALSFSANNYVNTGQFVGAAPPLTTDDAFHPGAVSWSNALGCLTVYNGTGFGCIGSGATTPGGPLHSVQTNNPSGTFYGDSNFQYDPSSQLVSIYALSSAQAGLAVNLGFVQADAGFLSKTCSNYNCFQAVNSFGTLIGGMAAVNFTAKNYVQIGSSGSDPTPTTGDSFQAAIYYNTGSACIMLNTGAGFSCYNGPSGGANTALSNLASVSINSALLFQTGIDAGSTAHPLRNLYLAGSGTYGSTSVEFTGTPTGNRTITIPDVSGNLGVTTGALSNGHCAQFDSSARIVDSGGSCGSGSSQWTTSGSIIYYPSSTGSGSVNVGATSIYSLAGGVAGDTLWALAVSGGKGLLRLSDGTGGGGIDGNGAQIYLTGSNGNVEAKGEYISDATGASIAFQTGSSNFEVNGNGVVSAAGVFNSTGGSGGFNVTTNTAANSIQTAGGILASFDITAGRHFVGNGSTPSVNAGSGACPADAIISGSDVAGKITSVTAPNAFGCTVTFAAAYATLPACTISTEIGSSTGFFVTVGGFLTTNFIFTAGSAGGVSAVHYICIAP